MPARACSFSRGRRRGACGHRLASIHAVSQDETSGSAQRPHTGRRRARPASPGVLPTPPRRGACRPAQAHAMVRVQRTEHPGRLPVPLLPKAYPETLRCNRLDTEPTGERRGRLADTSAGGRRRGKPKSGWTVRISQARDSGGRRATPHACPFASRAREMKVIVMGAGVIGVASAGISPRLATKWWCSNAMPARRAKPASATAARSPSAMPNPGPIPPRRGNCCAGWARRMRRCCSACAPIPHSGPGA